MRGTTLALGLALLAGLMWAGFVQAQGDAKASKGFWFTRLFTSDKKAVETRKDDKKPPAEPSGPSLQEIHDQAWKDWMRRQDVCLRLGEIAVQTGDEDLERLAKQLNDRAFQLYQNKTGGIPSPRPAADTSDDPSKTVSTRSATGRAESVKSREDKR